MVKKFKPGLSDTFTLNVSPIGDLGDYLDEPGPSPVAAKRVGEGYTTPSLPAAPTRSRTVVETPPVVPIHSVPVSADTDTPKTREPLRESKGAVLQSPIKTESVEAPRVRRHAGPSREINMSSEVLRMFDELLELIRSGSGQRDTRANELIHALLLLVHEVKDRMPVSPGNPLASPRVTKVRWARLFRFRIEPSEEDAVVSFGRGAGDSDRWALGSRDVPRA